MPKTTFEKLLFACRWLLTPFYVALVVALVELLVKVVMHAYDIGGAIHQTMTEEEVILGALGIVDYVLRLPHRAGGVLDLFELRLPRRHRPRTRIGRPG